MREYIVKFLSFYIILAVATKATAQLTADHMLILFFPLNNITYPILHILFYPFIDVAGGGWHYIDVH